MNITAARSRLHSLVNQFLTGPYVSISGEDIKALNEVLAEQVELENDQEEYETEITGLKSALENEKSRSAKLENTLSGEKYGSDCYIKSTESYIKRLQAERDDLALKVTACVNSLDTANTQLQRVRDWAAQTEFTRGFMDELLEED